MGDVERRDPVPGNRVEVTESVPEMDQEAVLRTQIEGCRRFLATEPSAEELLAFVIGFHAEPVPEPPRDGSTPEGPTLRALRVAAAEAWAEWEANPTMVAAIERDQRKRDHERAEQVAVETMRQAWERGLIVPGEAEWPHVHYLRSSFAEVAELLSQIEAHEAEAGRDPERMCPDCRHALGEAQEFVRRTLAETQLGVAPENMAAIPDAEVEAALAVLVEYVRLPYGGSEEDANMMRRILLAAALRGRGHGTR